jgi:hypothetical protein
VCEPAELLSSRSSTTSTRRPLLDHRRLRLPGAQGALAVGTYVYGDYCTGEIFGWNGTTQSVLLDTARNVSSFGEDQAGELYVVGLGGTVERIAATAGPCTYSVSADASELRRSRGPRQRGRDGAGRMCLDRDEQRSWITINGTGNGSGNGTVSYTVAAYTGKPKKRTGR